MCPMHVLYLRKKYFLVNEIISSAIFVENYLNKCDFFFFFFSEEPRIHDSDFHIYTLILYRVPLVLCNPPLFVFLLGQ